MWKKQSNRDVGNGGGIGDGGMVVLAGASAAVATAAVISSASGCGGIGGGCGGGCGGDKDRALFKAEKLKEMVYLHGAILCEALRLYPPVPFQHKAPIKPDTFPTGHKVDPKNKVLFSLYAMGRMESIWGKDCLEFKPERWISESSGTLVHEPSYKFLAFNAGPRTCLGKEVAFTQMKAVAVDILQNYNVQVVEGLLMCVRYSVHEVWFDGSNCKEIALKWSLRYHQAL